LLRFQPETDRPRERPRFASELPIPSIPEEITAAHVRN
jgi:hypothetical protein